MTEPNSGSAPIPTSPQNANTVNNNNPPNNNNNALNKDPRYPLKPLYCGGKKETFSI
jgi:hypothetical protein